MIKIEQQKYDKAKGQLRLQLNGVFGCFRCYGLEAYIDGAIDECVHLSEQFAMRVRGKDVPITMKGKTRRRPTE